MEAVLSTSEMQRADRFAIESVGLPETLLMEHAGLHLYDCLEKRWKQGLHQTKGLILAGPGNNGGDALALSRILFQKGFRNFTVALFSDSKTASSKLQKQVLEKLGVPLIRASDLTREIWDQSNWIVDGLFGVGLKKDIEGPVREIVTKINQCPAWKLAVDIPSGLCSDTGNPRGAAVEANETLALGYYKRGHLTGMSAQYTGHLKLAMIQIPREIPGLTPRWFYFESLDAKAALPLRKPVSHKGTYGKVYVWAGEPAMEGAAALTALGALRSGTGLVTILSNRDLSGLRPRLRPEIMAKEIKEDFKSLGEGVYVVGPGLGQSPNAWQDLRQIVSLNQPTVIDADALNLFSNQKESVELIRKRTATTVLTPHPQEAARLLGISTEEIQRDRYLACEKLVEKFQCSVILKGKGTLLADRTNRSFVVTTGNSSLSKAGTGDILSGILAGMLAQSETSPPLPPLALGVFLHGKASEIYSQRAGTERSALASEIADTLTECFKEIECQH